VRWPAREGGDIAKEDPMTTLADITRTWPTAVVDIGPIELTEHRWGIVGTIPYDGHVVLAVIEGTTSDWATRP
jgi:hypothetical protein